MHWCRWPIGQYSVAWQSCAGIAVFAGAVIIYSFLLQWLPLNVAQSFAALQFIAVIVASAYFLSEPISLGLSLLPVFGAVLAVGIAFVLRGRGGGRGDRTRWRGWRRR